MELDENGNETDNGLPIEIVCLEMANSDPLRAQEIYEGLSRKWFNWYMIQREGLRKAQPKRK